MSLPRVFHALCVDGPSPCGDRDRERSRLIKLVCSVRPVLLENQRNLQKTSGRKTLKLINSIGFSYFIYKGSLQ